jgi:hypothetical protein
VADITQSLIQEEIATSLLGEPEEQQQEAEPDPSYFADSVDLLNSAIDDQRHSVEAYGDAVRILHGDEAYQDQAQPSENSARLADLQTHREDWRPQNQVGKDPFIVMEAERRKVEGLEQQQQETQPQTPEQIQESIQALDTVVRENNLNDAASAKEFATDFCGAFGSDPYKSGVNVEGLGNVMAKTAFSALNA